MNKPERIKLADDVKELIKILVKFEKDLRH